MENNSNSVREFEYLPKQKVKEFAFCKPVSFDEGNTHTMVCSDNIDVAKNIPIENDHFILTVLVLVVVVVVATLIMKLHWWVLVLVVRVVVATLVNRSQVLEWVLVLVLALTVYLLQ